jgi:hypothetical protein
MWQFDSPFDVKRERKAALRRRSKARGLECRRATTTLARERFGSSVRSAWLTAEGALAVVPMTGQPRPIFGSGSVRAPPSLQKRHDGRTQTDVSFRKVKTPAGSAGGRNERFWIFLKHHGLAVGKKKAGGGRHRSASW